jgi:hypothetical protein
MNRKKGISFQWKREIGFIVDKNYLALSYLKGMWEMRWTFLFPTLKTKKEIKKFNKFPAL